MALQVFKERFHRKQIIPRIMFVQGNWSHTILVISICAQDYLHPSSALLSAWVLGLEIFIQTSIDFLYLSY